MTQPTLSQDLTRPGGRWRARLLAALAAVLLLVSGGCSDEAASGEALDGDADAVEDATGDGDDVATDGQTDGGETIEPPPPPTPRAVDVSVAPTRALHRPGGRVTPTATVYDLYGDVVALPVTWRVEPEGGATPDAAEEGAWTLVAEGPVRFIACADDAGQDGAPVCGAAQVLVDADAPLLEVLSPLPGATLSADEAPRIEVVGVAEDTHGALNVYVNGVEAPLEDDGGFRVELTPTFGVNHIEVIATDGLRREARRVALDVLWADGYLALDPAREVAGVAFDDALQLRIGQAFFDDRVPLEVAPEQPIVTRDLVDIVELLLREAALTTLIPDPVIDSSDFTLRVLDVDLGAPRVSMTLTDGGAELFISIPALRADTEGGLDLEGVVLDLSGGLEASVSAVVTLRIAKTSADAPYDVAIDDLSLAIESVTGDFTSDEANALFEVAESALRTTISDMLLGALDDALLASLPALIEDLFASIDGLLAEQTLPIDADLLPPMTLTLSGAVDTLEAARGEHLTARVSLSVRTDQPPLHVEDGPGVPLLDADPAGEPFYITRPLQIGARLALLNGLFYTLWDAGLLDLDLTAILPESLAGLIEGGHLSGRLPPVVVPGGGGDAHDLYAQIGQAQLTLVYPGQTDVFALNIEAGLSLDLLDSALTIELAEAPEVEVWLLSTTSEGGPFLGSNVIKDLVVSTLWPEIQSALGENTSLSLPELPLDALTELAPSLAGFELLFNLARAIDVHDGHVLLDVEVQGTLVP